MLPSFFSKRNRQVKVNVFVWMARRSRAPRRPLQSLDLQRVMTMLVSFSFLQNFFCLYIFFSKFTGNRKSAKKGKSGKNLRVREILQKRGETKNILLFNFTGKAKCKCHDGNLVLCSTIFKNHARMYLLYKILFCVCFFSHIQESWKVNILYCKAKVLNPEMIWILFSIKLCNN